MTLLDHLLLRLGYVKLPDPSQAPRLARAQTPEEARQLLTDFEQLVRDRWAEADLANARARQRMHPHG